MSKAGQNPAYLCVRTASAFDGDLGADIASAIVYRDGNNGTDEAS